MFELVDTKYPQSLESAQEIQVLSESAVLSKSGCLEEGNDTGKLLSREASGSFASGRDVTVGVAVAGTCEN